jgi:hypothetical protein
MYTEHEADVFASHLQLVAASHTPIRAALVRAPEVKGTSCRNWPGGSLISS